MQRLLMWIVARLLRRGVYVLWQESNGSWNCRGPSTLTRGWWSPTEAVTECHWMEKR